MEDVRQEDHSDMSGCISDSISVSTSKEDAPSQHSPAMSSDLVSTDEASEYLMSDEVHLRERHSTACYEPDSAHKQPSFESKPSIFDEEYDFDIPDEYLNISLGPTNISTLTESDSFDLDSFLGIKKRSAIIGNTQATPTSQLVTSVTAMSQLEGSGDVIEGSGDVIVGSGDVIEGSGDVINGPGEVIEGSGDIIVGSGDVIEGSEEGPCDVIEGSGDVIDGPCDVVEGSGDVIEGPCDDKHLNQEVDTSSHMEDPHYRDNACDTESNTGSAQILTKESREESDTIRDAVPCANESGAVTTPPNATSTCTTNDGTNICTNTCTNTCTNSTFTIDNSVEATELGVGDSVAVGNDDGGSVGVAKLKVSGSLKKPSTHTSIPSPVRNTEIETLRSTMKCEGVYPGGSKTFSSQQTGTKTKSGTESTTKSSKIAKSCIPSKNTSLKPPNIRTQGLKKTEPHTAATTALKPKHTDIKIVSQSKPTAVTLRNKTTITSSKDRIQRSIPVPATKKALEPVSKTSKLAKPTSKLNTGSKKPHPPMPSDTAPVHRVHSTPAKDVSKRRSIATSTPTKIPSPSSKRDPYTTPVTNSNDTFTKDGGEEGGARERNVGTKMKRRSLIPMPSMEGADDRSPVHSHVGNKTFKPSMVVRKELTTATKKVGGAGVKGYQRPTGPMKVPQPKAPSAAEYDQKQELQMMLGKPKLFHSPVNKENQPSSPHSEWSPVRRKKTVLPDDQCFQCTKHTHGD